MKYYLFKAVLGNHPKIEITQERYDVILSSWATIIFMNDIEEQWDCVIQNYVELEQEMLKEAVNSMILLMEHYDQFSDIRLGFARRLSNFLSSSRAYLDFTPKLLKRSGRIDIMDTFKLKTSEIYEQNFGYRLMEALRNYSQHAGQPVHGAGMNASWIEDEETNERAGLLRHTVQANISVEKLRADSTFKKLVLNDIDKDTKTLNLAPPLRQYLEGLGAVHDTLRTELKAEFETAKETIKSAISEYAKVNSDNVIGLSAAKFDSQILIDKQNVFVELIQRTARLQIKNGTLKNYQKRYVSSEIIN